MTDNGPMEPKTDTATMTAEELAADTFNKELTELLDKHGFQVGSQAFLLPDGRIGSRAIILKKGVEQVENEKEPESDLVKR